MEFKLNRINSNSITVSLTPTQFEWIMHCIESCSESIVVPGDKEDKYICYENSSGYDESIGISVIDRKAKFGVIVSVHEASMLKTYSKILIFAMKFQQAKSDQLKDVTYYVVSSVIAEKMKNTIETNCLGCKEESLANDEHTCLRDLDKASLDEIFYNIISANEFKEAFGDYFEYYADILNISEFNKKEAMHLYLPIIIGDNDLFDCVLEFFNEQDKNWKVKAVRQMNMRKKEIDGIEFGIEPRAKKFCK